MAMSSSSLLNFSTSLLPKRRRLLSAPAGSARERSVLQDAQFTQGQQVVEGEEQVLDEKNSETNARAENGSMSKAHSQNEQADYSLSELDMPLNICPICFCDFNEREVCSPNCCLHKFCTRCLLEWAQKQQTCPIDREPFDHLKIQDSPDGPIVGKIDLATGEFTPIALDLDADEPLSDISSDSNKLYSNAVCEVCAKGDREERLLLCDDCDAGYHLECLNPPLDTVPDGDWYCPDCSLIRLRVVRRSQRLSVRQSTGIPSSERGARARRYVRRRRSNL